MGLIQAGLDAAGGVLADQWREYFYCDALDSNTLLARGAKRTGKRGSNKRGEENVISDGSIVAVADGQCMLVVENGEILDVSADPGEFVYETGTEPTVFTGDLGEGLMKSFEQVGRRFTFGGSPGKDQRVYYVNTKEIPGNKYGTPTPVSFRFVDKNIGLDTDMAVRCNGEYSYRIVDPLLFYKNVAGNVSDAYTRDSIDSQLKSQLLTALQPAFARVSALGLRPSEVMAHTKEIAEALNEELSGEWREARGIEIVSFGINSISLSDEDREYISQLQRAAVNRDPTMAAANITAAQAQAMRDAANNAAGAAVGFMGMGMGMAGAAGGVNAADLFAMGAQQQQQQQQAQAPAPQAAAAPAAGWTCECGTQNTGKFCSNCGSQKPEPAPAGAEWVCPTCGNSNAGKFCANCGQARPADDSWLCPNCASKNTGKFCGDCGHPRP